VLNDHSGNWHAKFATTQARQRFVLDGTGKTYYGGWSGYSGYQQFTSIGWSMAHVGRRCIAIPVWEHPYKFACYLSPRFKFRKALELLMPFRLAVLNHDMDLDIPIKSMMCWCQPGHPGRLKTDKISSGLMRDDYFWYRWTFPVWNTASFWPI